MVVKRLKGLVLPLVVCVIICSSMSGCDFLIRVSGLESIGEWLHSDMWTYDLQQGYKISKFDPDNICMQSRRGAVPIPSKDNASTGIVVNSYITHFCYGDDYIAVKRVDTRFLDDNYKVDYEQATVEYYLINAYSDFIYGPFITENDFLKACEEWEVDNLCDWIPTVPMPEGARK